VNDLYRTLIIHVKTSSITISLFHHDVCIFKDVMRINTNLEQLEKMEDTVDRYSQLILQKMEQSNINVSRISAVGANGGLIRPVEGGTYTVNEEIIFDLSNHYNGMHVSNIAPLVAYKIAKGLNINAYIVDPPVVNEMNMTATYTGLPDIERKSIFHALNQKYVARKVADSLNKAYEDSKFIIAHISSGISIGAHEYGNVIDVNNGFHGEGPFSWERAGTIPSEALIQLCFSKNYAEEEVLKKITHGGGIKAYLETDNIDQILRDLAIEDKETMNVFLAMGYQIAKEIGSMASVLKGNVDAVIITGELANITLLTDYIIKHVDWIADVFVYEGEYDVEAINESILRVLNSELKAKDYDVIEKGEKMI